jgi:tRNA(His) 5'-end guanylyltransferase
LKVLEQQVETLVSPNQHFIIRLDGVAFNTFTKGIQKPFDERLTLAMIETTKDLVSKFNAVSGYHQSDEISLVFPAADLPLIEDVHETKKQKRMVERCHIYGGRIQKLASVTSSYASSRLNYYLSKYDWQDVAESVRKRMLGHEAYFDGRVIPTNDPKMIAECIFWRSNCDGLRNAISHIAQIHFKQSELNGKSLSVQIQMLKDEKNVDIFDSYSNRILFGTWVKKEQYEVVGMLHPKTGLPLPNKVFRSRIRVGSFNWANWQESQRVEFIMEKLWQDSPMSPPKDPL